MVGVEVLVCFFALHNDDEVRRHLLIKKIRFELMAHLRSERELATCRQVMAGERLFLHAMNLVYSSFCLDCIQCAHSLTYPASSN